MNIENFRKYCLSLKAAEEKMPFGEDVLVFYVKGKIFCLVSIDSFEQISVKCDPDKAVDLRDRYSAVIPGYHLNKKHWNTIRMDGSVSDRLITEWVRDSYNLVIKKLPKRVREELNK